MVLFTQPGSFLPFIAGAVNGLAVPAPDDSLCDQNIARKRGSTVLLILA